MITHNKLILASTSRSRYKILKNCGLSFKQVKPLCDEEKIKIQIRRMKPAEVAKRLSLEKAKSISKTKKYFNKTVIGCDTLIHLNNRIFDKAKNLNEARQKLLALSGKYHNIVSGLTICTGGVKTWQCSVTSAVKIRKINSNQINKYLKNTGKQILNSVGCYQLESLGPHIIEDIKGDHFNVLGIPLFKLLKYLSANK